MSQKTVLSRIAASALAMGIGGFVTAAQAQDVELSCRYFAAVVEEDDSTTFLPVTGDISVTSVAVEGSFDQSELKKATGPTATTFETSEVEDGEVAIEGGSFTAEVDAKLKDIEIPDEDLFRCVDSAKVRGVGELQASIDGEQTSGLIRSNSRLDGRDSTAILGTGEVDVGDCPDGIDEPCSVHPVGASLKITAQGEKGNGDLKYDRFTLNQKDIFESYVGARPGNGEHLVLVCSCSDIPEAEVEEPEEPVEEPVEE